MDSTKLLRLITSASVSRIMHQCHADLREDIDGKDRRPWNLTLVGEVERRGRKAKADPTATVRKVLDDERYHQVREVCGRVGEGAMAGYVAPT